MNCMIRTRKTLLIAEPSRARRPAAGSTAGRAGWPRSTRGEWLVANSLKIASLHRVVLLEDDRVAPALDQHLRVDHARSAA